MMVGLHERLKVSGTEWCPMDSMPKILLNCELPEHLSLVSEQKQSAYRADRGGTFWAIE